MKRVKWAFKIDSTEVHMIQWEDHSETEDDDVAPKKGAFMQVTVGFLVEEGDNYVILAMHVDEDDTNMRYTTILTKNITKRKVLFKPKKRGEKG